MTIDEFKYDYDSAEEFIRERLMDSGSFEGGTYWFSFNFEGNDIIPEYDSSIAEYTVSSEYEVPNRIEFERTEEFEDVIEDIYNQIIDLI